MIRMCRLASGWGSDNIAPRHDTRCKIISKANIYTHKDRD